MPINSTSVAAAVAAGVKNKQFAVEARNLPRKVLIIGTYDPLKTSVVDDVPIQILSPEDAGDKTGFGFMLHRLAVRAFQGSNGAPTYLVPQSEAGGAVASTGDIDWAGTAGVKAGTLVLYIANIRVPVAITDGMTLEEVSDAVVAAVNAIKELPVTAAKRAVTFETDFTAKSKSPWGDEITIALNLGLNEVLPDGIVAAITAMSGGATYPDISTALDGLGTGDGANEDFYTDVVHGYGLDTATLNAISTYVGPGNEFNGLYSKTVARPFRAMTGDTAPGSSALIALKAIADARKLDRANMVIAVPDSYDHSSEIAAQAIGVMARINQDRAAQGYVDEVLEGVHPGDKADRWTSEYDVRDDAVKSGISTTFVKNGVVTMQNIVTFYRPDSVPIASNGYRRARDISIHQNVLDNIRANFAREKWQGIIIVKDVTNVASTKDREKARDVGTVIDDLMALARSFADKAWIYDDAFTIDALKQTDPPPVVERAGLTGFDSTIKMLLSGEGGIMDVTAEVDASIAILSA